MIERHIKKIIDYSLKHFPCIILSGPRQTGKTTLLTNEYENKGFNYVTLDNTADRLLAQNDPKTFLEIHPFPLIIDEAQKATQLFPEIECIVNEKRRLDGDKSANGIYILSGSSRKDLLEKAKESLAGRAALLDMSPLSISEIYKRDNLAFFPDPKKINERSNMFSMNQSDLLDLIVKGQLPGLFNDEGLRSPTFYSSYINTYLEKDVREQIELKDESKFYNLLILVASLTGQQLNYDNLAKQIGVSAVTVKSWITVMVKTGIISLLQPYYEESWTKRVVKTPKVYFFDTGVVCFLLNIDSKETLSRSYLKGSIFETFVFNELKKSFINGGEHFSFYYYRDQNQNEIDFIYINKGYIYAIESKFGENHSVSDFKAFRLINESRYEKGKCSVICSSEKLSAISDNIYIVPIKSI